MMPDALAKRLTERIAKGVADYEQDNIRHDVAAMARKLVIARFGHSAVNQTDVDEAFRVATLYFAELRNRNR
jgi:hypothetical protein